MATRIAVCVAAAVTQSSALIHSTHGVQLSLRGSEAHSHVHRSHPGAFDDKYVIESWRDTGSGFLPHQVVQIDECICSIGTFWNTSSQMCEKQKTIGGECGPKDGYGLRLQVCQDGLKCSDWGLESCPPAFYLLGKDMDASRTSGDICCNIEAWDSPCGHESFAGHGFNDSWVCPRGCSKTAKKPFCKQDALAVGELLDDHGQEITKACRWQEVPAQCVGCGPEDDCQEKEDRRVGGTLPFEDKCARWYIIQANASSCTHLKAFPADYEESNFTAFVHVRERVQGTKHTWGCVDTDEGVLGKDGLEGLPEWARDGEEGGYCSNIFYEAAECTDEQDDDDFKASKMCCACGGGENPAMGPDEADDCLGMQEGASMLGVDLSSAMTAVAELASAARARCEKEDGCVKEQCSANKSVFASPHGLSESQAWWCNPKDYVRMDEFQYYELADGMLAKVTERAAAKLRAKFSKS